MGQFQNLAQLLSTWDTDDPAHESKAVEELYRELRRVARRLMQGERPDHTLQATALANELFLRLDQSSVPEFADREHLFAFCARLMRQILIDHARTRRALKRGDDRNRVPLTDVLSSTHANCDTLVQLSEALESLRKLDARQADVAELRVFGGLSQDEIANFLGITSRTVDRDWRMAKLHFSGRLQDQS
jgi:RNA polymerase sigma factor (TIGR02999 family)